MLSRSSIIGSPPPASHKLIVGVDFGTTFTGVSYVLSNNTNIHIIDSWPGPAREMDQVWKAPSRIAYADENEGCTTNQTGYLVKPGMKSYSWFKLRLDRNAATIFDDPTLYQVEGSGMLRLPHNKTAQEVCADYLREVYKHLIATLHHRGIQEGLLNVTPMEFWFTVPAIWSDTAKNDTLSAARAAGFASRPSDQINLIPEPEAAAVFTLKSLTTEGSEDQVAPGDAVLICDCGGGTVDITTYTIRAVNPQLEFDELLVGEGGKCGSTYIDRQFHEWMSNRFGAAFDQLCFEKKGPGSRFMKEFEGLKRDFGFNNEVSAIYDVTLVMPGVESSEYYDATEQQVKLHREDLEGLFRPVVSKVLDLLRQQTRQAQVEKGRQINKIVLVGGFGDSRYLNDEIRAWSSTQGGIKVFCPENPQAAIVMGAAVRGLGGIRPKLKLCRRHYGFQLDTVFDPSEDDPRHMYVSPLDKTKRVRGSMVWPLQIGAEINENTYLPQHVIRPWSKGESLVFTHPLYSSSAEAPPRREDHPRVQRIGTITVDLRDVKLSRFKRKWKIMEDRWVYHIRYELQIMMGKREGILTFRAKNGDKIVGNANILYNRD